VSNNKKNHNGSNACEIFFHLDKRFSHKPGLELGATDSAHEVFFGRRGSDDVAVKPYRGEDSLKKARHESRMLSIIRRAGFLSLEPLTVIADRSERNAFLLTRYVPNLTSMAAVVAQQRRDPKELIRQTAVTLAQLHGKGISHGDAQIKNFALFPGCGGKIAVIDPEKGGQESTGHYKVQPYHHDLESLGQSLAHKGYGGYDPDIAGDILIRDVVGPYVHVAEKHGVPGAHDIGESALMAFLGKHSDVNSRHRS